MRPAALILLLLAGALLPACNKKNYATPVEAYLTFHEDARRSSPATFQALSTPTRQVLEARAKETAQASGGLLPENPAALLFMNAAVIPSVTRDQVQLVRADELQALLRVGGANGPREVRMIKEPAGWRVDLTDSLR